MGIPDMICPHCSCLYEDHPEQPHKWQKCESCGHCKPKQLTRPMATCQTKSMNKLGGSLFIRNAIKFDYCVKESIQSIADVCEEVVVLDAQSDDGTTEMLRDLVYKMRNVRLIEGANWNCASDFSKLRILANQAIDQLNSEWHFMIQADEVLHESSKEWIWKAIEHPTKSAFHIRRLNLFGDVDHHISFSLPEKPCSDIVNRLAKRGVYAHGDAESLADPNVSQEYLDKIVLFHYGYVREDKKNVDKAVVMQSWFNGDKSKPDSRLVEMQKEGVWRPEDLISWDHLAPIPLPHPKWSEAWATERRKVR